MWRVCRVTFFSAVESEVRLIAGEERNGVGNVAVGHGFAATSSYSGEDSFAILEQSGAKQKHMNSLTMNGIRIQRSPKVGGDFKNGYNCPWCLCRCAGGSWCVVRFRMTPPRFTIPSRGLGGRV